MPLTKTVKYALSIIYLMYYLTRYGIIRLDIDSC